ncbi:MAG: Asp-tRNA(Asn)/Glu-tRNA(Gln) amidotransferase subunit GatC [Patescibacteria group bacterium]
MGSHLGKIIMISKQEVKHIAKLARLELTEKETEKMQKDLSGILDYFNLLRKADTSKLKKGEFAFAKATANEARKDEAVNTNSNLTKKIIEAFPNKEDDYIKVKTIL